MKNLNKIIVIIIMIVVVSIVVIEFFYYIGKNSAENISDMNSNTIKIENDVIKNEIIENKLEETNTIENEVSIKNVYTISDCDFDLFEDDDRDGGIKIFEYDDSNEDYAEIYYVSYDYTTDPSYKYTLEITDESNKSVLYNNKKEENVIGGIVSKVKIKKLTLKEKITFSIFEKNSETNEIYDDAKIQIDLSKKLKVKEKIDKSSKIVSRTLGDVKFKCIYDEYEYFGTTSHSYSKNLIGENCSFSVNTQYGDRLINEEHIEVSYDKNVNNLSLEKAFENLNLITSNVGQYGLSDVYGMDIYDKKGEHQKTVVITFEDMIDLCNGLTIEKDGEKYTKDSFETNAEMSLLKDEMVEIGKGIQALKYHYSTDESVEYYMFEYNNNIYYIRIPKDEKVNDEVKLFLDSLELIK